MRIGSTLQSYPVFPDWVFTGEVMLTKDQSLELIKEAGSIQGNHTDYGFATKAGTLGKSTHGLTNIIGNMFYEETVAHFRLSKEWRNIECVDTQYHSIKPGQSIQHTVNRHRWYQCAMFMDNPGSDIFLERFDGKLYSTPPGVQEYKHVIKGKQNTVVFWPAYIPWGFTANKSKQNTLIFTATFIIKR